MIDKVPDPEFLPGGESEDQCDGWTYHLEFILPDEYKRSIPLEGVESITMENTDNH